MKTSDKIDLLAKALIEAQKELKNPKKTAKGVHNSMYATLDQTIDETKPILTKHGLVVIQLGGGYRDKSTLWTRLQHESGQYIESCILLEPEQKATGYDPQKMGSMITYYRRYMLSSLLNIASEEDNDGKPKDKDKDKTKPKTGPSNQEMINKIDTMLREVYKDKPLFSEADRSKHMETAKKLLELNKTEDIIKLGKEIKSLVDTTKKLIDSLGGEVVV